MGVKEQFDAANYGIFAGSEGLANVNEMDVEQTPDFYSMSRVCEGCGCRRQCQIDWAELYCLQYGVNPAAVGRQIGRADVFDTSWVYDPRVRCFHPNYRCSCNGNPIVIFNVTPTEAERVLHQAGRNSIISDAQQNVIRTIAPVVKQLAGARSGVPAQQVQQQYARMQPGGVQGVAAGPHGVPMYPPGYIPPGMRRR